MTRPTPANTVVSQLLTRRRWLQGAAGLAAGTTLLGDPGALSAADEPVAAKGRVKQSIVQWCFQPHWKLEETCQAAKKLGCVSVELIDPKEWGTLKKYGLVCAIAPNGMPGPPFVKGFNNPKYHDEVIARLRTMIDTCAEAKCPSVITFSGYKWRDAEDPKSGAISQEEGADNCVAGLKKIIGHAEKKGVTICMEHLNTRDDSHPMKGHPGYQGDDLDWMARIIRRVGSPRMKVLFDIYHVQIMHGDVIRRIHQNKDIIGHVHTAGNPGRGELDDKQEINYPPIMRALIEIGYQGYVGQEFIPTRDPFQGLKQAVTLCAV
jgi:hydroxypyruvate isomerase